MPRRHGWIRRAGLLGATLAVAGVLATTAGAGGLAHGSLPHPRSTRLVPYRSVGGIRMGRPLRLPAGWPRGICSAFTDKRNASIRLDVCAWQHLTAVLGYRDLIRLETTNGIVYWWQIYTDRRNPLRSPLARWRLPSGIHLGSPEAAVLRHYHHLRRFAEPGVDNVGLETTTGFPRVHDDEAGITFLLHDGRVYEIDNTR